MAIIQWTYCTVDSQTCSLQIVHKVAMFATGFDAFVSPAAVSLHNQQENHSAESVTFKSFSCMFNL